MKIENIELSKATQFRDKMNSEVINEYTAAMFTYDPFSGLKFKHYYRKNKRNDD